MSDTSKVIPRWLLFGQIVNKEQPDYNGTAILLVVDSKKEKVTITNKHKHKHKSKSKSKNDNTPSRNRIIQKYFISLRLHSQEIGLGRGWKHPPLTGNQAHVAASVLRLLHLQPNVDAEANLRFDLITMAYVTLLLVVD